MREAGSLGDPMVMKMLLFIAKLLLLIVCFQMSVHEYSLVPHEGGTKDSTAPV